MIWNVKIPVVEEIEADSAVKAIRRLAAQLDHAGFNTVTEDGYADAFLSENQE